ncbi:MAG: bifunctional diaminohydroxyphosphoribosylaminopyrimidine deaminase/5-amino-6-(5-phosphoribosylamino)uracil reductase RibD [Vicinamibacteria bacterium]|nr:bifunctional diaminohydroxyphosphoribosylaminopyrimidine deaminase/5-amino-6-(5-phosphoribosylamino)uracil reductase RibD [Vicinamibacteria bacterium]
MRRVLSLAARGAGETNPNPMVGCVIVRDGMRIAEGYHRRAGEPHAEVVALERARHHARGATLYVNLEPCVHHGRTPPCAPRIVTAGIRRVVVALRDPNPKVDGRGLACLRRAGVDVRIGVLGAESAYLNRRFLVSSKCGRPYVLLKAAITLDARIATSDGRSKWITSRAQRDEARRLRRLHDAVVVGIGTVLRDDPMLMPSDRPRRPFFRVVLDSRLRIPLRSRLVRSARHSPVIVAAARSSPRRQRALEAAGVEVVLAAGRDGRVSLKRCLRRLVHRGITSVMVEGGSEVLGSFLAERLVDEVALFRAPLLLGGRRSRPVFGGPNPKRIAESLRMSSSHPILGQQRPVGESCEVWYPIRGAVSRLARYWRSSRALS